MTRLMEQTGVKLVIFKIIFSLISMNEYIFITAAPKFFALVDSLVDPLVSLCTQTVLTSARRTKESGQLADDLGVVSGLLHSFSTGSLYEKTHH